MTGECSFAGVARSPSFGSCSRGHERTASERGPRSLRKPLGRTCRADSVAVVLGLEGPCVRNPEIRGLLRGELGQLYAELCQVKCCHLLVELLGEGVHLALVFRVILP